MKVYFVPFFGADYNVLYVDSSYEYALVGGNKKNYLWILSRNDTLDDNIYEEFTDNSIKAKELSNRQQKILSMLLVEFLNS